MGSGCSSNNKDKKVEEEVIIDEHDYLVGPEIEFRDHIPGKGKDPKKFANKVDYFKQVKITDNFSVLVTNVILEDEPNGEVKFVGIGAKCTHYGADLGKGVMKDGRIYCPWHGACFDFETGDIEEFPGLDNVPSFPCKVKNQQVFVRVEPDRIQNKVMRPLTKCRTEPNLIFVIIGSGAAGYMCAQTLRQEGFDGQLVMITADKELPYDRPKLSKAPGSGWDDIKLRGKNFYADNDIDVFVDSPVEQLQLNHRKIFVKGQDRSMGYDSLFIAVGNRPRTYNDMPGQDLNNIVTLHNCHDSQWIAKNVVGKRLLISGSSFIAMELASSLKDKCESITILARGDTPFSHVFGVVVGKRLLEHLLKSGPKITFISPDEIVEFEGDADGAVCAVNTKLKKRIECDVVVLALGAVTDTKWVHKNPFKLHPKNKSITVDERLQTNISNVFAGGDCVNFPIETGAKRTANIGHWQVALTHGRVAALNMLGHDISVSKIIPFFWTSICGVNIRSCGYNESFDEVLIFGSLEKLECCVIYRRSKRLLAALGMGCDPLITQLAVELQTEAKWHTKMEFPECLTKRFPGPPESGLTESEIAAFAKQKDSENPEEFKKGWGHS